MIQSAGGVIADRIGPAGIAGPTPAPDLGATASSVGARGVQSRVRSGAAPRALTAIRYTTLFMTRDDAGSLCAVRAGLAQDRCSTDEAAMGKLL